jgi:hypothetical protein
VGTLPEAVISVVISVVAAILGCEGQHA